MYACIPTNSHLLYVCMYRHTYLLKVGSSSERGREDLLRGNVQAKGVELGLVALYMYVCMYVGMCVDLLRRNVQAKGVELGLVALYMYLCGYVCMYVCM